MNHFVALSPIEILALAVVVMILFAGGCATERREICFERFMGKTEEGFRVVALVCMSPEAFVESQKGGR